MRKHALLAALLALPLFATPVFADTGECTTCQPPSQLTPVPSGTVTERDLPPPSD